MKSSPNEKTMKNLINRKHIKPYADALLGRGFRVDAYVGFTRARRNDEGYTRDYVHLQVSDGKPRSISIRRSTSIYCEPCNPIITTEWDSDEGTRNGRCPDLASFLMLLDHICPEGDGQWN